MIQMKIVFCFIYIAMFAFMPPCGSWFLDVRRLAYTYMYMHAWNNDKVLLHSYYLSQVSL